MHSKWMRRFGAVGLIGAIAWTSAGCAERDPINRVQPNALQKSFFIGEDFASPLDDPEFYMRNTLVDVGYGSTQDGLFTATYAQPVSRIKWEVTERKLIARLTYERIDNSDHHGSRITNNGQIVASFNIISHFDVRPDYNPGTGEQTNVTVENASDRPWNEREYIRVDWSRNEITSAYELDTMSQLSLYGGIKWDPMTYEVNDPSDPNAPVFAATEGYFDVTQKAFATPDMVDTPWGVFPSCYFFGIHPAGNCNPTEITLRLSFKKVVDTDFEPTEWTGNHMDAFGVFYQERQGYERNYGLIDDRWHRYVDKYNTWERSHISFQQDGQEVFPQCGIDYWRDANGAVQNYRYDNENSVHILDGNGLPIPDPNGRPFPGTPIGADPNRGFKENGIAEECDYNQANLGAYCDQATNRCSMPMFERKIKTIPWYFGPNAPKDLFPSTANATAQWNLAIKHALQLGRKAEWDRLRGSVDGDGTEFPEWFTEQELIDDAGRDVPDVFVLCHNPVIEGDHAACGAPGTRARLGDLRYNIVDLIDTPQMGSPWGIMVDGVDPLTGEKVNASINEWIGALDSISQGVVDTMRWLNGEVTDQQVMNGEHLNSWLAGTNRGLKTMTDSAMTKEQIQDSMSSVTGQLGIPGQAPPAAAMKSHTALRAYMKDRAKEVGQVTGPSIDASFEANRKRLIDSKFEAMLATPGQVLRGGFDPQTPVAEGGEVLARSSILRGLHPDVERWKNKMFADAQARNHFCVVQAEDSEGYVSLARQAAALFPLPDENAENYAELKYDRDRSVWTWIREQLHVTVILHEMGHSVSLRHNFVSNFDALNFHTQYWQVRTNNGREKSCTPDVLNGKFGAQDIPLAVYTTPKADGNECTGPRWVDPVTEREINGNVWKWGNTTVMDYPGDMAQETVDLGPYDKAAMRFVYGGLADVDDETRYSTDKAGTYLDKLDGFGGVSGPIELAFDNQTTHSGELYGDGHYTTFNDRFNALGECSAQSNPSDVLSAKCTGFKLKHRKLWDMRTCTATDNQACSFQEKLWAFDPQGRVRHPYMFGSDEYADGGNVPVFRNDAGADPYEQMAFLVNNYENRYIFTHFRKKNRMFFTGNVVNRIENRYLQKMQAVTKAIGLYYSILPPDYIDLYMKTAGGLGPHLLASAKGFDEYASIMTRPEPGKYYYPRGTEARSGCVFKEPTLPLGIPEVREDEPCVAASNGGGTLKADFIVPVGSGGGRYLHNEYDYSQGYFWSDYQKQVGSFYEKIAVIYYLMEGYNHFVQNDKDDYIDGRFKNINYASIYPEQMRKLYAYMMQDDKAVVGPYVKLPSAYGTGQVTSLQFPKWSSSSEAALTNPSGTFNLNPLVGWEQQYPMLVYGFYFGATTLTMDWVQNMRVFNPSGPDAVEYGDDRFRRYVDPLTGLVYVARLYGQERTGTDIVERGIGARMLEYANTLATDTFKHTIDGVTGDAVWERNAKGEPVCADDSNAADTSTTPAPASVACQTSWTKLRLYSSNLDTLRELADWMGIGPMNRF